MIEETHLRIIPSELLRNRYVMLTVVGSVAIDTIELLDKTEKECLGGSGTYAALAARLFSKNVALVSVIGYDFPNEYIELLRNSGIILSALSKRDDITSFRWHGRYQENMNIRETVAVTAEILLGFEPELPPAIRNSSVLLLANSAPQSQKSVLTQMQNPHLVLLDTMDIWIKNEQETLFSLFRDVDILLINEQEARLIYTERSLFKVIERIVELGVSSVVVKKGAEGVLAVVDGEYIALPAFPLCDVYDPTGAGDVFAGALAGYLASVTSLERSSLKEALAYATVTASFCCESCGADRFAPINRGDIEERLESFRRMVSF